MIAYTFDVDIALWIERFSNFCELGLISFTAIDDRAVLRKELRTAIAHQIKNRPTEALHFRQVPFETLGSFRLSSHQVDYCELAPMITKH
jgi:hypothetical protein